MSEVYETVEGVVRGAPCLIIVVAVVCATSLSSAAETSTVCQTMVLDEPPVRIRLERRSPQSECNHLVVDTKLGSEPRRFRLKSSSFGYRLGPVRKSPPLAVVVGKSSFLLYDLRGHRLLGPYHPEFRGLGSDSQSGNLRVESFLSDGSLLLFHVMDSSPSVYDLTDMPNVVELLPTGYFGDPMVLFHPQTPKRFTAILGDQVQQGLRLVTQPRTSRSDLSVPKAKAWERRVNVPHRGNATLRFDGVDMLFLEVNACLGRPIVFSKILLGSGREYRRRMGCSSELPITLSTRHLEDGSLRVEWTTEHLVSQRFDCPDQGMTLVAFELVGRRYWVAETDQKLHFFVRAGVRSVDHAVSRYLNGKGHRLYRKGRLASAKRSFGCAIQIDPRYLLARTNLAATSALKGDARLAVGQLEAAALLDAEAVVRRMERDGDYDSIRTNPLFTALLMKLRHDR